MLTHTEISAEKIAAYRATDYRFGVGADAITLRIDEASSALQSLYVRLAHTRGVFITAFNPQGATQDAAENEAAHVRLGRELRGLYSIVIEGAGADPTGAWPPEKSYFALGVDLETARVLGRRYQQDAVVWTGKDAIPKLILLR